MGKKKKNNDALRKVMASKSKIEMIKSNERTDFFNGAIRLGGEIRSRDVNFINNGRASTILGSLLYDKIPTTSAEKAYNDFLMDILDCFVVRLKLRTYQIDFLLKLVKNLITIDDDKELQWDFNAVNELVNESPLFTPELKEDVINLFKNIECIFDTNIYKSHTKDEILKKFYDYFLVFIDGGSFIRSGVLKTNLEDIHLPLEEDLTTLTHKEFIYHLKRRYVSYAGYVDNKKLARILAEHKAGLIESDV